MARKAKKDSEVRNDVTLNLPSLGGITPRRKPKAPVSKKEAMVKTSSNKTLPPRKDRRDPSMGAVIASVADTMGHILTSPPRVLYTWAKEPTGKGFIKGIGKFNKIIRDSGKRAERRFHASQTNYPKKKRTKSKTKAVNTRLGGG